MIEDFYITRRSNDMKIAGQKNHLVGQVLYRSLVPIRKTASLLFKIGIIRITSHGARLKSPE